MKTGDTVYGDFKITREERWKIWDVFVCANKSSKASEWYYDSNTGFLVGMKSGFGIKVIASMKREEVLVNTNAEIALP